MTTILTLLICDGLQAGPVNTAIYSSYSDNYPNGVHFSGAPVDNISTSDFQQFGSTVSWNWHPDGLAAFASDTVGRIQVTTADTFTFILAGAQDSFAFVDGQLVVPHGSDAVAQSQNTISLSPGIHTVEVQYDIAKPASQYPADIYSGYEMSIVPTLPGNNVSIVASPEPAGTLLVAIGTLAVWIRTRERGACPTI